MSGGHFDYQQYQIGQIAESIESIIHREEDQTHTGWKYEFTPETLAEFKTAVELLKQAEVYAQRIDWLVSGDDGEETFHKRLRADLEKL